MSAAPIPQCGQIVDVDFPNMALSRAEWNDQGSLFLRLAPLREDPTKFTTFRLVGVQPRQWDVQGPDGTTLDITGSGVIVRVPMVAADMEFSEGSY